MKKCTTTRLAACAAIVIGAALTLPGVSAAKVVHVGTGREFACEKTADGEAFDLPADFKIDANADVFKIVR